MITQTASMFAARAVASGAMGGPGVGTAATASLPYGAIALGAFGGILGGVQAVSNNKAIKRNLYSLASATSTNLGQVNQQATLEQFNNRRAVRETLGRVATAIAASGGGGGVTASDLQFQVAGDGAINQSIINTNRGNQNRAIRSQYQAQAEQIRSQWQNPLLAGAQAALGTFSMGINLFQGLSALDAAQNSQISASRPLG